MATRRVRTQRGAAIVDFVLVLVVLVPLVLGILQVALVLYVRNTIASAAAEGARLAATADRGPEDGAALTRSEISGVLSGRYATGVTASRTTVDGQPGDVVTVRVRVPALGIGGPAIELVVTRHAVEEPPP